MRRMIEHCSYWLGETLGRLDERCERITVPPMDQTFERLVHRVQAIQQSYRTRLGPWFQGRNRGT